MLPFLEDSPSNTLSRGMLTRSEIGRLHLSDRQRPKKTAPRRAVGGRDPCWGADRIAVVSAPITAAERHKRMPARGHAASLVLGAARIEAEEADDWRDSSLAEGYRAQALAPLSGEMIVHGAGGELVPRDSGKGAAEWRLLDTVQNPNYVTADASRGRLDLAQQAGALEEALDAADTIEARDSLEH